MSEQKNIETQLQIAQARRELNRLTEIATRTKSRHVADLLRCQHLISDPSASLVFGGHFKSGKSTLLNTLIGRDLLPTSTLPETGVQCVLSKGASERIEVFRKGKTDTMPLSTEGIKRLSTLLTFDGQRRDANLDAQRIEVTAPWFPMANGVKWIDAPGYNDTKEMDDRLLEAARAADLLIWVLHSQPSLSEVEVDFLSQFVSERGAGAVLFVINVFLSEDSPPKWQTYMDQHHAHIVQRVRDREAAMGFGPGVHAKVLPIAARAQGTFQEQAFGGIALRRELAAISSTQHPLCVVSRYSRARLTIGSVGDACREELAWLQNAAQDHRQREESKVQQRRDLRVSVLRDVNDAIRAFWSCWSKVETNVISRVQSLDFDSSYSTLEGGLNDRFSSTLSEHVERLRNVLRSLQTQYDYSGSSVDLCKEHIAAIQLGADLPVKPDLPNCETTNHGKVGGAAAGAFLGPLGILGGIVVGSIMDKKRRDNALQTAAGLRAEWMRSSESRIRTSLDSARQKLELGFTKLRQTVEAVWLPDISVQPDNALNSKIKGVQEMMSAAQDISPKLDIGLWRIVVRAWSNANRVAVAGNFNKWDTDSHPLTKTHEGSWTCELALPKGDYTYKFHVDGQWHLDPASVRTRQDDGITNCVISVP